MRLGRDEIRLIAALLVALGIGAAVEHYRSTHPPPESPSQPQEEDGEDR